MARRVAQGLRPAAARPQPEAENAATFPSLVVQLPLFNEAFVARRLLEQEEYESGIALLVEVTEAAPNLTMAHIDLGIAHVRVGDDKYWVKVDPDTPERSPSCPIDKPSGPARTSTCKIDRRCSDPSFPRLTALL